jgi:hypothetical protein
MGIILVILYALLHPLVAVYAFVLVMRLFRYAIRTIAKRLESRPVWTAKDESELRDLMRQWAASE